MNLNNCYRTLGVSTSATDDEIKGAFKSLAHKYHPDKNPKKLKWATQAMADLNVAYTTLIKYRFQETEETSYQPPPRPSRKKKAGTINKKEQERRAAARRAEEQKQAAWRKARSEINKEIQSAIKNEILTKKFVRIKDSAKNEMYRYFQYGLYNLARRNRRENRTFYDEIVLRLRVGYHILNELSNDTEDPDFVRHFNIFRNLLYSFYMTTECINVIDSFSNAIDFQAYELFKKGDDSLNPTEKEIFFDRHNRGFFKKDYSEMMLFKCENYFKDALKSYPDSTWSVETNIKLNYTLCLKEYVRLFFSEDDE